MVAPNGARKTKKDHPNLPITISEIVSEAKNCYKSGADGLHAHIRDNKGNHSLDVGLYKELLTELKNEVPNLPIQITTESIGKYSPDDQIKVVEKILPESASIALSEIIPNSGYANKAKKLYEFSIKNNIQIQHILYTPRELEIFSEAVKNKIIPRRNLQVLFVLGKYSKNFQSNEKDLEPFIRFYKNKTTLPDFEWSVCAFGKSETNCLIKAYLLGGKARVGFENNIYNKDGSIALSNSERVLEIAKIKKLK